MKAHPTNPHGVLVQCSCCGRELHIPRDEATGPVTCSFACMTAMRSGADARSAGKVPEYAQHMKQRLLGMGQSEAEAEANRQKILVQFGA